MSDGLDKLLERVRSWPSARKEQAEQLLQVLERQDDATFRLTSEQEDEVRRRMADPTLRVIGADEIKARFLTRNR